MNDHPERKRLEGQPVFFAFQPHSYEVVTGDRLKQWEADMREQVMKKIIVQVDITVSTGTYSFSGPSDQAADDCDAD
ncbi:hypothetical protein [Xanthomonas hortorum]|uniref:Uncharacterized protein n=1 Tax=Xanthomonas hortorum TaxID=56454 RepID=A0AA47EXF7_9XANT|nr:hypothetical protein [Xanthomonas hortorum]WAH66118.1 hypothetical protein OEG85_09385 [Xanthomonas hortorum]